MSQYQCTVDNELEVAAIILIVYIRLSLALKLKHSIRQHSPPLW